MRIIRSLTGSFRGLVLSRLIFPRTTEDGKYVQRFTGEIADKFIDLVNETMAMESDLSHDERKAIAESLRDAALTASCGLTYLQTMRGVFDPDTSAQANFDYALHDTIRDHNVELPFSPELAAVLLAGDHFVKVLARISSKSSKDEAH